MSHVDPLRVGSVEISVVCQGYAPLDLADECPGQDVDWDAERSRHPWAFLDERHWPWHVHAFVIRAPWGVAVVDTGVGAYPPYRPWAEDSGTDADDAFRAVGVDVSEVTLVVLSHLHADHAGGSWAGDGPRFPNARCVLHGADLASFAERWEPGAYAAVPEVVRLRELGMLDLDPDDRDLAPGLRVVHTPGHTPGHRSAILRARDERLLITGDLLHHPVQAAHPSWPSSHDDDPDAGAASRVGLLVDAATRRWVVGVPHFARPFGRVDHAGWQTIGPTSDPAFGR